MREIKDDVLQVTRYEEYRLNRGRRPWGRGTQPGGPCRQTGR